MPLVPESPQPQPVNGFPHPFVKVVGGQYVESVVYEIATGRRILCWPVDARELVATGEYSYDKPEPKAAAPEVKESTPAPETESAPASRPKRGPGHPRKPAAA